MPITWIRMHIIFKNIRTDICIYFDYVGDGHWLFYSKFRCTRHSSHLLYTFRNRFSGLFNSTYAVKKIN